MEENTKPNDYFAARLLNADKGAGFLISEGIDASNSEIQDRDFYKSKAKVQEAFQKDDGTFDEDKFNKFYDDVYKEYNYESSIDTQNFFLDAYEKSESDFSTNFGHVAEHSIGFSRVANPLDQSFGLDNTNTWSTPTKSRREAAQKNQYFDNETGKWSEETVNEAGLWGVLSGKPLVYAVWDDDGTHVDPMTGQTVEHKKGDWKTDEFSNYYAETVDNEEVLDKDFVTWSEVVTDDDSPWNKIDIFDSDDLDSNIMRPLIKGAAMIGASLISPPVGAALFYTTAAVNLARVLPQISKSIGAFFGAGDFDTLNKWDNVMRRFGTSQSDYARDHFLSLENILNMAIDSYSQLHTQRLIAQLPQKLGIGSKAAKDMARANLMTRIKYLQQEDMPAEVVDALAKSTKAYRDAAKALNQASKISTAVSRAYLIATSVDDVYNQAKIAGFDNQTAGLISLATYGAIGTLFQTDYFRGMLANTPDYEMQRDIKAFTKQWIKNNAARMQEDLGRAATETVKKGKLKSWGNKIYDFVKNHIDEVSSGRFGIVSGALNEGTEEVMEEVAQDLSFQVGKAWQGLKGFFTGKEYTNDYSYLSTNPFQRYAQSFFGGALGGAIFKASDRFLLDRAAYSSWKNMMGDNSEIMKEIVDHITAGRTDMILESIDRLESQGILSNNISAFTGAATNDYRESQNGAIFSMFKKAVKDIDSFLKNNNLQKDYDEIGDIEVLKGLRAAWLKTADSGKGLQDSLYDDYRARVKEVVDLQGEIQSRSASISDTTPDVEKQEAQKDIAAMQQILDFKIQQLHDLANGKDDSYIGRLMLESNKDILDKIVPTTKDGIAQYLYGMEYDKLPKIYRYEVDKQSQNDARSGLVANYISAWNIYKGLTGNDAIKTAYANLDDQLRDYQNLENLTDEEAKEYSAIEGALRLMIPGLSANQIKLLYFRSKGQIAPTLDFQGDDEDLNPDIALLPNGEWNDVTEVNYRQMFQNWRKAEQKAIQKMNDDPEAFQQWYNDTLQGKPNDTFTIDEAIALRTIGVKEDDFMKAIERVYKRMDTIFNDLNRTTLKISTKPIDSFIAQIARNVNSLADPNLINQQLAFRNKQGSQYFLSDEVKSKLNELEKIFDLVEALTDGSDSTRRKDILGIPFGANNYLNQAFKDKGIDLDLAQISAGTVAAIKHRIQYFRDQIQELTKADAENRGSVITAEKKLGILLSYAKLRTAQQLLDAKLIKGIAFDDINRADIDGLVTDQDYIDLDIKLRNRLLEFERNLRNTWLSLDDDVKKQEFIDKIREIFDAENLFQDTNVLTERSVEKGVVFNDSMSYSYIMSAILGNTDVIVGQYRDLVKDSKLFPFDSQEEVVEHICKFLLADDKSIDDLKVFVDGLISDEDCKDNDLSKIYRGIKVVCSGGTGKTEALIPLVFSIVQRVNPNKNIVFAANTNAQLDKIQNSVTFPEGTDVSKKRFVLSEILNYANESDLADFKTKFKDSIIVIDECTYLSSDEIVAIDKAAKEANAKVVYLGDTKQHSNGMSIDAIVSPMTIQLADSKRVLTDIARQNNSIFEQLLSQDTATGSHSLSIQGLPRFTYYEEGDEFAGIKFDNGVLNNEYIKKFYANHHLPNDTSVLIFAQDLNNLDLSELKALGYNVTVASDISQIQGLEYDYTITDYDLSVDRAALKGNDIAETKLNILNKLRDIYTLFTRHKNGLVSLKPLKLVNLQNDMSGIYEVNSVNNVKSSTKPVQSGLLGNPEVLKSFVDYKQAVLDGLTLNGVAAPKPPVTGTTQPSVTPTVGQETVNPRKSIAQCAVGFMKRDNFTPEFIKSLGIEAKDYGVARNKLYLMLVNPNMKDSINATLPSSLQGGRFLIKVEYCTENELYELGNLHRDKKSLKGTHPWIIYRTKDGKEIYLGMFHNAETSESGGQEISHTSEVINSLGGELGPTEEEGVILPPKYYEIPDSLTITRSQNIIDIQNRVTNDGSYLRISFENGRLQGKSVVSMDGSEENNLNMDFLETTAAVYFRKGNENLVPVSEILGELNNHRALYREIFNLAIGNKGNGPFVDDPELIKDLIAFDRGDQTKPASWKARGVPDLENKFVVFAKLKGDITSTNTQQALITDSNQYLATLKARSDQLNKIIGILKSNKSIDDKKSEIAKELSNRILLDVAPIALDQSMIETEDELRNAIDYISVDKIQATGRKLSAYNDAITHQLGTVLRKMANILKLGRNNKLFTKAKNGYFSQVDYDTVSRLLGVKTLDSMLVDHKNWSGNSKADYNTLTNFLANAFTKIVTPNGSNGEESYENTEYFINDRNENLLQSESFKDFFVKVYFDTKWNDLVKKMNLLRFVPNEDQKVLFSGYIFPKLIRDNGINVLTDNQQPILNAPIDIKSKVIQLGRIHIYGDDNLTEDDFKEVDVNSEEESEETNDQTTESGEESITNEPATTPEVEPVVEPEVSEEPVTESKNTEEAPVTPRRMNKSDWQKLIKEKDNM